MGALVGSSAEAFAAGYGGAELVLLRRTLDLPRPGGSVTDAVAVGTGLCLWARPAAHRSSVRNYRTGLFARPKHTCHGFLRQRTGPARRPPMRRENPRAGRADHAPDPGLCAQVGRGLRGPRQRVGPLQAFSHTSRGPSLIYRTVSLAACAATSDERESSCRWADAGEAWSRRGRRTVWRWSLWNR
jgi:hypothetical protein